MDFLITAIVFALCLSPMCIGIYLSMSIFKMPDITTDGSYTLGAVITALALSQQFSLWLSIPLVLLSGAFAGTVTGIIHTKLKIEALLSGILVMTALYSINLLLLGKSNFPLLEVKTIFNQIHFFSNEIIDQLLLVSVVVLIAILAVSYLLSSDAGLQMRAVGCSPTMSKAMSINNNAMKILGLAASNALTALSGFLVAQYQNYTDINMGIGIVITVLGSVLIAQGLQQQFSVLKISSQIALVIIGAIIFQAILALALSLGIDPRLLKMITALFVLAIVSITKFRSQRD